MYQSTILKNVRSQRILHEAAFELTYRCNLDCFYCYNDRDKVGKPLSLAQYEVVLNDLAKMQTLYLMLTGGEPLVHPQFFEIGQMAKDLGFVTRVRTNGHGLGQRACRRLKQEVDPYVVEVSLHGADAETHDCQTRVPGSFDRLIRNVKIAGETGLRLSIVSTPTAWNEHQIEAMFDLCDSFAVPLRFQGPVSPRDNGDISPLSITPAAETWRRIATLVKERKEAAGDSEMTCDGIDCGSVKDVPEAEEDRAMCGVGVSGVDIDPYGNVQACVHLQKSAGNLHHQPIAEIWNHSPLFEQARARSINAAKQFTEKPVEQLGAPLFCIAVAENCAKGFAG